MKPPQMTVEVWEPSADPLAEVIAEATFEWFTDPERLAPLPDYQAAAVRAHIAAVLDAEEAKWADAVAYGSKEADISVRVLRKMRSVLVGEEHPGSRP